MITITRVSTLPTPPDQNDPDTFSPRANSFLNAFPLLQSEINQFAEDVEAACLGLEEAQINVSASAATSEQSAASALAAASSASVSAAEAGTQAANAVASAQAAELTLAGVEDAVQVAVSQNTTGWEATATYDFPQLVAGSDGYTYRALKQSTGIDPTNDDGANWLRLVVDFPHMSGNAGKTITTDGVTPGWAGVTGRMYYLATM